jgi:hypothetical protein
LPSKRQGFTAELIAVFENTDQYDIFQTGTPGLKDKFQEELEKAYSTIGSNSINYQSLFYVPLKESKWSDNLIIEVEKNEIAQIKHALDKNKTISEFFNFSIATIYDIIARRVDLCSYYQNLHSVAK